MDQAKPCSKCKVVKPLSEFPRPTEENGMGTRCRKCRRVEITQKWQASRPGYTSSSGRQYREKNKDKINAQRKAFHVANPGYSREQSRRYALAHPERQAMHLRGWWLKKYGLSIAQYEVMLSAQNGGCAICGSLSPGRTGTKNFCVDHDHTNGKTRGLLCHPCNQMLGLAEDSAKRLLASVDYLVYHGSVRGIGEAA